jgi:hypothetical protein
VTYRLLQFNLGTGRAQGFVLQGEGEHEGTNVPIDPRELDAVIARAEDRLRLEHSDYRERSGSLLKGRPPPDERLSRALAEFLDGRFLRGHAERLAQAIETGTAKTEGLGPKDESAVTK